MEGGGEGGGLFICDGLVVMYLGGGVERTLDLRPREFFLYKGITVWQKNVLEQKK